jgi:maltose alpha-D-glucosyltransferase/alpha-amylase
VPGQYGVLEPLATPVLRTARAAPRSQLTPSVLQATHHNTSVRYGTHVVLKLFRCIDEGLNPDLELGRFLTAHGFAHTPPVAGALTYTPHRGESMSVAIVQRYVPNQGTLQEVLQTARHAYFTRVRGRRAPVTPPLCAQTVLAYGGYAPSAAVQAVLGEVRALVQVLGQRTAEMHLTLASDPTAPAFTPVPFTTFYQRALYQAERSRVGRVFAALHKQRPLLPAEAQAQASRLLTLREPLSCRQVS